jgi:hypothetical protein
MVIVHGFILTIDSCQKHSQIKSNANLSVRRNFNRKEREEGAKYAKLNNVLKLNFLG